MKGVFLLPVRTEKVEGSPYIRKWQLELNENVWRSIIKKTNVAPPSYPRLFSAPHPRREAAPGRVRSVAGWERATEVPTPRSTGWEFYASLLAARVSRNSLNGTDI